LRIDADKKEVLTNSPFGYLLDVGFQEATWKKIEFQYLKARLNQGAPAGCSKQFGPLMEKFLQTGFQAAGNGVLPIGSLFEDIITYIPDANFNQELDPKLLVHYKLVHDLLMFIQKYHPEAISQHFEQSTGFQNLVKFKENIIRISRLKKFMFFSKRLYKYNMKYLG
jgi:hypothetical protein